MHLLQHGLLSSHYQPTNGVSDVSFDKQPRCTTLTFLSLQFRQPNLDLVMDLRSRTFAGQVGAILGLFLMLQKNNTWDNCEGFSQFEMMRRAPISPAFTWIYKVLIGGQLHERPYANPFSHINHY